MSAFPILPVPEQSPEPQRELPDYLPARMVNEFAYCPRLFFYEWVEGLFAESVDTVEGSIQHARVDIGMAVAIEDGLITPVIRDADKKTIGQIATEAREMAKRARDRKLRPDEYTGATFSVSNLGMMGIRDFAAIINPPESGILAVGTVRKEPVVKDNKIVIGQRMSITLSCDHRVVDGALGAKLLQAIVAILEKPISLAF